ncbi:ABC transporter permease [Rhodocaloribacter sp.]
MKSKAWLVFRKEILTMVRDRRLTISVVVISLLVMPLLMGFIGNIDRLTGAPDRPVTVIVQTGDDVIFEALAGMPQVQIHRPGTRFEVVDGPSLRVVKEGALYRVYGDGTNGPVWRTVTELKERIEAERDRRVAEALAARGITPSELRPFEVQIVDTAGPDRRAGILLSVLIPYLAIILLVSNANRAMYVAVGEKEKNTLATLLVSNAPRRDIVIGKILAIMVFSVVSSLLLVVGMILFANFGFSLEGLPNGVNYSLTFTQVAQLIVNLTALAFLIAAIIMLLGTYARSAREAGIYTTPLLFIAIFLAVFSFSSTDFGPAAYAAPILGNALSMRDTFLGNLVPNRLLLAVTGNLLVFLVLVVATVRMYHRERILFRE